MSWSNPFSLGKAVLKSKPICVPKARIISELSVIPGNSQMEGLHCMALHFLPMCPVWVWFFGPICHPWLLLILGVSLRSGWILFPDYRWGNQIWQGNVLEAASPHYWVCVIGWCDHCSFVLSSCICAWSQHLCLVSWGRQIWNIPCPRRGAGLHPIKTTHTLFLRTWQMPNFSWGDGVTHLSPFGPCGQQSSLWLLSPVDLDLKLLSENW